MQNLYICKNHEMALKPEGQRDIIDYIYRVNGGVTMRAWRIAENGIYRPSLAK